MQTQYKFPSNLEGRKLRNFQSSWFTQFPWLLWVQEWWVLFNIFIIHKDFWTICCVGTVATDEIQKALETLTLHVKVE